MLKKSFLFVSIMAMLVSFLSAQPQENVEMRKMLIHRVDALNKGPHHIGKLQEMGKCLDALLHTWKKLPTQEKEELLNDMLEQGIAAFQEYKKVDKAAKNKTHKFVLNTEDGPVNVEMEIVKKPEGKNPHQLLRQIGKRIHEKVLPKWRNKFHQKHLGQHKVEIKKHVVKKEGKENKKLQKKEQKFDVHKPLMKKMQPERKPWMAKKQAPKVKKEMKKRFQWVQKQAPRFHKEMKKRFQKEGRFQARKPWMAKKQAPRFHKEMKKRFQKEGRFQARKPWMAKKQAPRFHKEMMEQGCENRKDCKKEMPKKFSRCYRPKNF